MLLAAPVLAAQIPPDLYSVFKIEVVMPGALVSELPQGQIQKDIELVLRRNGVHVGEESAGQILQLKLRAVTPEDHSRYAIDLRLELLTPGYTLGTAIFCSGKPSTDSCWTKATRMIGSWSDEHLLLVGPTWVPEVRQSVKDLADSFALYYLRRTQEAK